MEFWDANERWMMRSSILAENSDIDLLSHGTKACPEMTGVQLFRKRNCGAHKPDLPINTFCTGYGELPEGSYRYMAARLASVRRTSPSSAT